MKSMICPKRKARLGIYGNYSLPGCRDWEEIYCLICDEKVDKIFTSGIPTVIVISE